MHGKMSNRFEIWVHVVQVKKKNEVRQTSKQATL